ncbi:citrate lyase subunit alpha [Eubacteriales bacterium OttesenSCG-928-K08]|nr:citrate lyase subunit alpha [Eubacteriales bacterium OttesenSCG-928-K08]
MNKRDMEYLNAYGNFHAYVPGENPRIPKKSPLSLYEKQNKNNKIVKSLEEAVRLSGLKDGMTISFHHHFRAGDYIVNMVLDTLAQMGFRNLTVAASSLTTVHAPMIEHIKNGVVTGIETSGLRGELATAISHGLMERPVVFRSHGGRASAIMEHQINIDVAFLGASSCDPFGNANGYSRSNTGKTACGSLGYAKVDANYAGKVIIITDNIVDYPNTPFGISQKLVDYIVKVDAIGNPQKIMSGATRFTKNPHDLLIAEAAAKVIFHSGYFNDGFSLQTGSGGAALAVTRFLRDYMVEHNVRASYALGGITGAMVRLHEEGLIRKLLDVQSFDLDAANSLKNNRFHAQIDANYYASPFNEGAAVNQLDIVVLSALEIDVDFNVNVLTGSDGIIRGAIGGHPDTAGGASLSIIVAPLLRGRMPTIMDRVNTIVTPGHTVDVLVTDQGVAVNPRRPEIAERLKAARLDVTTIDELKARAERVVGVPEPLPFGEKIVGVVTYRDGSVIDVIHEILDENEC